MRAFAPLAFALSTQPAVADVVKLDCLFDRVCSQEAGCKESPLALTFHFDTSTEEAFLVGNVGLAPVVLLKGNRGVSFLEGLATGAVQTTTVTNKGDAVHSRHTMIADELVPSQFYGTCAKESM